MRRAPTPERSIGRSGVFVFLLVGPALIGCEALEQRPPATIQLDTTEVQLEGGSRVHDIVVAGVADIDSIAPTGVRARVGDAVRFVIDDHRTHALAFDVSDLDPAARDYLDRTNQLRGPPLVNRGAAWVVVLEDAPPGLYPFLCRSHGARGAILVDPAD